VEPIGILAGQDALQHRCRVEVVRQRQLHQKGVDLGIAVQLVDERLDLMLGGGGGQAMVVRPDPGLEGVAVLDLDIDLRRRVVPDQQRRQAHPLPHGSQRPHSASHLGAQQSPGFDTRENASGGAHGGSVRRES
jgi:hypothetical protein